MPPPGETDIENQMASDLPSAPSPPSDSWAMPPPPEPEASTTFLGDTDPNVPPPSYEEATNPKFQQRFKKFQNFAHPSHPAEVSRITRQMSRHLSRNGQQTDEPGETTQSSYQENFLEPDSECSEFLEWILALIIFIIVLGLVLVPFTMIIYGGVAVSLCWFVHCPYPMWLIVGGIAAVITGLFYCGFLMSDSEDSKTCFLCLFGVLFIFLVIWNCIGCYYVWGVWDEHGFLMWGSGHRNKMQLFTGDMIKWEDFKTNRCVPVYYFAYSLVVAGMIVLGLGIVVLCVAFIYYMCGCAKDNNDEV